MATTWTHYKRSGAKRAGSVYECDLADGETSDPLVIYPGEKATITAVPAATGKAQVTTVPPAEVATAADAQWSDWDAGEVTAITDRVVDGEVTGIRGVSVTGNLTVRVTR